MKRWSSSDRMGRDSPEPQLTRFWHQAANVISAYIAPLLLGIAGGALMVVLVGIKPKLAALLIGVIPVLCVTTLRPRLGVLLAIFLFSIIDEFPGGIGDSGVGGDEFSRSERTPFYSAKIGLPALYPPDAIIFGLLMLFILKAALWRDGTTLRLDKIGVALLMLAGATMLSLLVPFTGPAPFGPEVLDLSTLGSIELKGSVIHDVARYVAVLHYKLFILLFPSYVLGLFYFREQRDIDGMLKSFGVAMCGAILIAGVRLARQPSMIAHLVPVVFDTGAVAFMAMAIFYTIGMWTCGHYKGGHAVIRFGFCALLALFILTSFRRTMWGAIALALLFFPFILPRRAWPRLLALISVGVLLGLIVLGTTGPGQQIVMSILSRVGETNRNNSSTLYRFALAVWFVKNVWDVPFFGYGIAPLWNEIIRIRFFQASLENVHSLYLWIVLRLGIFGFLTGMVSMGLILMRIREVFHAALSDQHRILVGVIFLSVIMLLFNGMFNPVYANVRHIVPLGFTLALVTRLPYIIRAQRAAAANAGPAMAPSTDRPTPR